MDIKQRIDALTEAEAKAALTDLLNLVGTTTMCNKCILCNSCDEEKTCKEMFLDWALD